MTKNIKVIYIMGCGRSGSTILDTILGHHIDIESVGELTNLVKSAWINNEYCACGKSGQDCSFWNNIKQQWRQKNSVESIEEYLSTQQSFERLRKLPELLINTTTTSHKFRKYIDNTYALFEAISIVSSKNIIVDSSKTPVRALALSMIPKVDLYFIHLVRDGRGVAWSLKKSYKRDDQGGIQKDLISRPVWRTALLWSFYNLLSELVMNRINRNKSIQIRYEDLISSPKETLESLETFLELDFSKVIESLLKQEPIAVGHTIAGNRLRMKGNITLQPDREWIAKMPLKEREIFWVIAGHSILRYGYKKRVSA